MEGLYWEWGGFHYILGLRRMRDATTSRRIIFTLQPSQLHTARQRVKDIACDSVTSLLDSKLKEIDCTASLRIEAPRPSHLTTCLLESYFVAYVSYSGSPCRSSNSRHFCLPSQNRFLLIFLHCEKIVMPTVKGQIDLDRAVNEHFFGYTESTKLIASLEKLTQYRQPGSWKSQARAEVRQYRPEMQRMLFDLQMFNLGVLRRISCFEKVLEGRKRQLSGIMDARRELLRAGACLPAASLEADWERDEEDCEEIAHYEMLPTQGTIFDCWISRRIH